MAFKIALVCCLLALASAKQLSGVSLGFLSGRIVGGKDAERGEFPHQISMQKRTFLGWSHSCGGSILNEKWVLTAAHCVVSASADKLRVLAGRHLIKASETSQQASGVSLIIVHDKYPSSPVVAPYDIALLKLKEPLSFNELVKPVALTESNKPVDGQVTLSGWGATDSNAQILANTLQKMDVPVITNQQCKQIFEELTNSPAPVHESNVCTGPVAGGTASCAGDSGGPLVKYENGKAVQVGIVSWGLFPCAKYTGASVYTRVASYVDWIESNIAEN